RGCGADRGPSTPLRTLAGSAARAQRSTVWRLGCAHGSRTTTRAHSRRYARDRRHRAMLGGRRRTWAEDEAMTERFLQAETTVATREDAERLAAALVEARLAACAQIVGPMRSVYRWEGEIQHDDE